MQKNNDCDKQTPFFFKLINLEQKVIYFKIKNIVYKSILRLVE